jgi:tetratricopeptide (TPR) repeat protein/transcriptional regulator with XRE-family HTH domain
MRVLGRALDAQRRRQGLTYRDVEQRTGLSRSTVQYLVARRTSPPGYYELVALVERLGGTWDEGWEELWRRAVDGGPEPAAAPAAAGPPTPLPPDVRGFGGRAAELAALDRLLDEVGEGGPLVVAVLSGTAGVGKTALAVHWAHRARAHFPDGRLHVDLHGYGPEPPLPVEEAQARLLAALGQADNLPAGAEPRAALLRTRLDGRRMLLLLDNAADVEQVRPLLPGTATCLVLVTSRDSLPGLVAREGAHRIELDPLPAADATALLGALVGDRARLDPAATAALAERCDRLPLALRVAAELAVSRPGVPLGELVEELSAEPLDRLDAGGDPRAGVRAVLSWSYRHLDPATARTFRLLGLVPGHDVDAGAVAALTGTDPATAGRRLATLVQASLVQPTGPGRFGMHDLLRAYARDLAGGDEAPLRRLAEWYADAAAKATAVLFGPGWGRPPAPAPPHPRPAPPTGTAALAWLDTERPALVAASRLAPGLGPVLDRYLDQGGHQADALVVHGHARAAARTAGDRVAEAEAEASLGATAAGQGRFDAAAEHLERALALRDDPAGRAAALSGLGAVRAAAGRFDAAMPPLRQALDLLAELADPAAEARVRSNLSGVLAAGGRPAEAAAELERALTLFRASGDRVGAARALANLGDVRAVQGREDEAGEHLTEALGLFRDTGDRVGAAYALHGLADLLARQGRDRAAADRYEQALALFREIGDAAGADRTAAALAAVRA